MIKGVGYIGVGVGSAIIEKGKLFLARRGPRARNEIWGLTA